VIRAKEGAEPFFFGAESELEDLLVGCTLLRFTEDS
jgi:hypothetical protein